MLTSKRLVLSASVLATCVLLACGASDDQAQDTGSGEPTAEYDAALLEEYRAALPEEDGVTAVVPGPNTNSNALTLRGNAELAKLAVNSAAGVNLPAKFMVALLHGITKLPPTVYNSKKKEFVWGPWDNDNGHGQVLVYIKQNPAGDDFKYGYALVRLVDSDLDTAAPVIWGAGTPGELPKQGVGVTLWDFEANLSFDEAHDPDFDAAAARDRGRFAMVFGRGDEDNGKFAFNVAVFRDFLGKDAEPGAQPADMDYFFGHFKGADGNVIDFVDWSLTANLCAEEPASCFEGPGTGADETLSLRAAFVNRGVGRAEAVVAGGELSSSVSTVECWDEDVNRTGITINDDVAVLVDEGECAGAFAQSLEELGVPSLADVDATMLAKMDCVATNGFAACEEN